MTDSIFFVPICALTNTARAPSRLNTTVFRLRPAMKFLPRIVSVSPTATSIGETLVTTGALTFLRFLAWASDASAPDPAEATMATNAAAKAARRDSGRMRARSSIALCIGASTLCLEATERCDGVTTPRR